VCWEGEGEVEKREAAKGGGGSKAGDPNRLAAEQQAMEIYVVLSVDWVSEA
jgi:hypothetical protein